VPLDRARLRNSWVLISGLVSPSLASRAIWTGWALSSSAIPTVRLRTISPVARSSRRARSVPIAASIA